MNRRSTSSLRWHAASWIGLAGLCAGALLPATEANAVTVEKVVAVVGDEAILLSELQHRAEPFLRQVYQHVPVGPQRAGAESQMYKDLLEKMIEEELEAQAAQRTKTEVAPDELDKMLSTIADQQNMTLSQLFTATEQKTGLTEQAYRGEIRRQVLEGKLLNLRVRGRIKLGEEDLHTEYLRALKEEREKREYNPAWIVLRILPGSSPEAVAERRALAADIVKKARAGADFGELAQQYSDDTNTKANGGDLGVRAPQSTAEAQTGKRPFLSEAFEKVVFPLEPGDVAEPIDAGDGVVIIKLIARQKSHFSSYEEAKEEMMMRLQNSLVKKERDEFIEELKRKTHLERRL